MTQFESFPKVHFSSIYTDAATLASAEKEAKSLGFDISTFSDKVISWDLTLLRGRRYGYYTTSDDRFGPGIKRWGEYVDLPIGPGIDPYALTIKTSTFLTEEADAKAAALGFDITKYADAGHVEIPTYYASYKSSVLHDPQPGEAIVFRVMPAFNGITVCPLTVVGNTSNSAKPHHYEVAVLAGADTLAGTIFSIHNSLSEVSKVNVTGLTVGSETTLGPSGLKFKMAEGPYITGIKYIIKLEATAGNTSAALCAKVASALSQVSTIRDNQPNTSFSLSLSERPKLESNATGAGIPTDLRYTFAEMWAAAVLGNPALEVGDAQYDAAAAADRLAIIHGALLSSASIKIGRCYFEANGIRNYLTGGLGTTKDYVSAQFTQDVEYDQGLASGTDKCWLSGFSSPDTQGVGKFVITHSVGKLYPDCITTGNFGAELEAATSETAFIYFRCETIPSPNPAGYKGKASVKLLAVPY